MIISFRTKSDIVYESLRRDIIDGKLRPEQRITLSDLSQKFGFSGTPIREAIKRLGSEGLVQSAPHVGTRVCKIDSGLVIEIYLIRIELESLAAKLATPCISETDIFFLNEKIRESKLAIQQQRYERLGTLNKDFHLRIYKAAPSSFLFDLIVQLWEKGSRTRAIFALVPERAIPSMQEHKLIVEALNTKNASLVERLMREHRQHALKSLVDYFEKNNELAISKSELGL